MSDFMRDNESQYRRDWLMTHLGKVLNVVVKHDGVGAAEMQARRRETQWKRVRERRSGHSRDDPDMDDKAGRRTASDPWRRILGRLFKFPFGRDADCTEDSIHVHARATKFVWRHWNTTIDEYREMRSPTLITGLECAA
jgi:hypothetical protein